MKKWRNAEKWVPHPRHIADKWFTHCNSLFFISGDSNKGTYTPLFVAGYSATSSFVNDVKSLKIEIKIMGQGCKKQCKSAWSLRRDHSCPAQFLQWDKDQMTRSLYWVHAVWFIIGFSPQCQKLILWHCSWEVSSLGNEHCFSYWR